MTRKKADPKAPSANKARVKGKPGSAREAIVAELSVEPCMAAAALAQSYGKTLFGKLGINELHHTILEKAARVHDGNMREVESMLVGQATALNSMFASLARRANGQEYVSQFEAFAKLALRAQNQSRMTLETLATIKNPPVVFAKQANIANNQQVNNGEAVPVARTGETGKPLPELLEAPRAQPEWMDSGTPRAAKHVDTVMATVDTIDRAANEGRQSDVKP